MATQLLMLSLKTWFLMMFWRSLIPLRTFLLLKGSPVFSAASARQTTREVWTETCWLSRTSKVSGLLHATVERMDASNAILIPTSWSELLELMSGIGYIAKKDMPTTKYSHFLTLPNSRADERENV